MRQNLIFVIFLYTAYWFGCPSSRDQGVLLHKTEANSIYCLKSNQSVDI